MPTQSFSTNLSLSLTPKIDQNQYPQIYNDSQEVRNAIRLLQSALDKYTGALGEDPAYWGQTPVSDGLKLQNLTRVYAVATETIALGAATHLYNNAGALGARNANATNNTKPCRGFCTVSGGLTAGQIGEFILLGANSLFTGLTPGATIYLNTANGAYTSVAPATVGNIVQEVGFALSDTVLYFNPVLNWKQL